VAEQLVDGNHSHLEAVNLELDRFEGLPAALKNEVFDETSRINLINNELHRVEREEVSKSSDSTLLPAQRQRFQSVAAQLCTVAKEVPVAVQSNAFCLAGSCYRAAGKIRQARGAYQKALKISPKNTRAIFLLADLQYVAGGKRGMPPVEAYLKSEMASDHIPGLSVGVVHNGELVLAAGYGWANVELEKPATKDTVYAIASITKSFTATAIMLLVEKQKIELDKPISHYLRCLPNSAWSDITVRQLLTHTSGIPNFTKLEGYADSMGKMGKEELLQRVAHELEFNPGAPGAQWSYSNTGYLLLGEIIENVSQQSFGTFLKECIFGPLKMDATGVDDANESSLNRACGYMAKLNDIDWTWSFDKLPAWYPRGNFASGCLVSTVMDLVKWDDALSKGELLKKSNLTEMWIPAVARRETTGYYGLGWIVDEHSGHGYVGHGGITKGFWGYMMRFVSDTLTVILLTNGQCPNDKRLSLVTGIARYYLPAPSPSKTTT